MHNEAAFLGLQLQTPGADELWMNGRREDVRQVIAIVMLYTIDALSSGGKLTVHVQKEETAASVRMVVKGIREPDGGGRRCSNRTGPSLACSMAWVPL